MKTMDVVFCVDTTGSMLPAIVHIKEIISKFPHTLAQMAGTEIDFRVKFIFFKDYAVDSDAMMETEFFSFPEQELDAQAVLDPIFSTGGGDLPESGLEALYLAMSSDFKEPSYGGRQIIILMTDADAHDIGKLCFCPAYPTDMIGSNDELVSFWNEGKGHLDQRKKRLVIFAPDGTRYAELSRELDRCTFIPVDVSCGCKEIDLIDIFSRF